MSTRLPPSTRLTRPFSTHGFDNVYNAFKESSNLSHLAAALLQLQCKQVIEKQSSVHLQIESKYLTGIRKETDIRENFK